MKFHFTLFFHLAIRCASGSVFEEQLIDTCATDENYGEQVDVDTCSAGKDHEASKNISSDGASAPVTEEDTASDLGVPQVFYPDHASEIHELYAAARAYMAETVDVDPMIGNLCRNNHEHCAYWSVTGACSTNTEYMNQMCAPLCHTCGTYHASGEKSFRDESASDDEDTASDLGVPQMIFPNYAADIEERFSETRAYMAETVNLNPMIRDLCRNKHEHCAYWSVTGACSTNARFMNQTCAPLCQTCGIYHESGDIASDLGEPQLFYPDHASEMNELFSTARIHKAGIIDDPKIRDLCRNKHRNCAYWAVTGACSTNAEYMNQMCAPLCEACGQLTGAHRVDSAKYDGDYDIGVQSSQDESVSRIDTASDLGVPQTFFPDHAAEIEERYAAARAYTANVDRMTRGLCRNKHEHCAYWSVTGACSTNAGYMNQTCAPLCQTCGTFHESGDIASDLGKPQLLFPDYASEMNELFSSARAHVSQIIDDPIIRGLCRNKHEHCAYWSVTGACSTNAKYMNQMCAPLCQACGQLGRKQFGGGINFRVKKDYNDYVDIEEDLEDSEEQPSHETRRGTSFFANDLGEPQALFAVYESEMKERYATVKAYVAEMLDVDARKKCQNEDKHCAFWAVSGACDNDMYSEFMNRNCAPFCQTCGQH